ncbi:EAL domain-containing protein [Escherichia coli]|nr:EAL domain-containing protein [Escherichia coli]NEM17541.1 EAL domain-containing protein [Escherichia coli]NEM28278.1 EAL domain-containing protein [Escherichia coli]NEM33271.1 EAL domain-containing protein [Escherichia coli]NEM37949.1 EAL domain-containing protein [Escherichia coli]
MEVIYIAEPIISTNTNKLIAVEVLSRFYSKTGVPLSTQRVLSTFTTTMKINLLKSQIKAIISHRDFFERHETLCSVNVDYETCLYISCNNEIQKVISKNKFIALEISETYPEPTQENDVIPFLCSLTDYIWLDDFGSRNSTMHTAMKNKYHAIKLDKLFFQENIQKPYFEGIINNLKRLCPNIIAEGVENIYYNGLSTKTGLWGTQGYFFPSVPLSEIKHINSAWL